MSWTDGKPFTATEKHCNLPWSGSKTNFRCFNCGHKFKPGDTVRWQFTNDIRGAGGNPMVCEECDGTKEEIVAKIKEGKEQVKRLWWFRTDKED